MINWQGYKVTKIMLKMKMEAMEKLGWCIKKNIGLNFFFAQLMGIDLVSVRRSVGCWIIYATTDKGFFSISYKSQL